MKNIGFGVPGGRLSPGAGEGAGAKPAEATIGKVHIGLGVCKLGNDPSAGSPTETLLRLLLPLNDRVWITFRP
jgi:hypothetical protein